MAPELEVWREEFGCAYERWFPTTVRLLASKGLSPDNAREIAQTAWVRGWQYRAQLRESSLLLTWVNTIAVNIYRRCLRCDPKFLAMPEIGAAPALNWASFDVERILRDCSPRDRMILEQHHLEERSIGDIAREHRCSETAIRTRLMRARRSARAAGLMRKRSIRRLVKADLLRVGRSAA